MTYDSTQDTREHIEHVRKLLHKVVAEICVRITHHDDSKLQEPEKSMYDELIPRLKEVKFGSAGYLHIIEEMKPALQHHFDDNSHHPQHYLNGVNGMTLLDLIEMLADWKAASMRSDTGLEKGLSINIERFHISDQLAEIFQNTVKELGW